MAIRYATVAGLWSDVSTWDGGTTIPTVGDEVYANGFMVTVKVDIEVSFISNRTCPSTSIIGGRFFLDSGSVQSVIADVYGGGYAFGCIFTDSGTGAVTVIGNLYGGDTTSYPA